MIKLNDSIESTQFSYRGTFWLTILYAFLIFFIITPELFNWLHHLPSFFLDEEAFESLLTLLYDSGYGMPLDMLIFFIITILLLLFTNKFIEQRTLHSIGIYKKGFLKFYILGALFGTCLILTIFAVIFVGKGYEVSFNDNFKVNVILAFLVAYIFQSFAEELLFRGFIMNAIAGQKGVTLGIIINSILFVAFHLQNPGLDILPIINLFIFGIIFSLLFYMTNSIWFVPGVHCLWNFMLGPILGIQVSGIPIEESLLLTVTDQTNAIFNGANFGLEGSIVTTGVGLIVVIVIIIVMAIKRRFVKHTF
ncbi:CPBP family intramembrane metalloprotease [Staphylococcus massiliensis CCUG 55927]|uniref:CPBP family intramembrane glutamic endopeptidase n=1 Tax=Staphylococcus massiliensis TaxID=555791 RepID=UPI0002F38668|nr:type II CAAX endopeptidase family protein [Staphylococcus massiliensis]PNZ98574.1 CPBP family intramembrane metalloprotease [Staphylococcus massiliensis CCUG 55927]